MWDDPIVAEVRRMREQLAAQFRFDVKAIFEDLRKRQTALGDRVVSRQRSAESANTSPGGVSAAQPFEPAEK
jgi:hypothetical protein